jgi:RNA polymerase sigma factor (sigma-70 family)
MPDRATFEAQFLAYLPWMRRVTAALCRRHGLRGADVEDCTSWVLLRLLANDYAVLQKFRGESSVRTYLTVVLATLHKEYRVQQWGRWRSSAEARRRGPIAVRLEALVYRDRYSLAQAIQILRLTADATAADLSDRELAILFAALPTRSARGECELLDEVPDARDATHPEEALLAAEARDEQATVACAIAEALTLLVPEDREILRMRFWDGMTVAEIARALRLPQKPLYRRLPRILQVLRRALEARGVSRQGVRALLGRMAA